MPGDERLAWAGLRKVPPWETAGTPNPVAGLAEGGLVSTGDVHHAQVDCEACGTAIEMRSGFTCGSGHAKVGPGSVEFGILYSQDDYFAEPELAAPRRFYATTGINVREDDTNKGEDVSVAARNALPNSQTVGVPNLPVSALLPLDIFV